MLENAVTTITKKDVMTIGSKAWREGTLSKTKDIAYEFKSAGLCPLCFPDMQQNLHLFNYGDILLSEENLNWVR